MILLIISIAILFFSLYLFYQARTIKIQRANEIERINNQIIKISSEKEEEQKDLDSLKTLRSSYMSKISENQQQLTNLYDKQAEINNQLFQQKKQIKEQYDQLTQQALKAFDLYEITLDKSYQKVEENFQKEIKELQMRRESVQADLDQIKSVYEAAAAAKQREKEIKEKQSFYKIKISEEDATDISKLQDFKSNLYNPTIVGKVIWSTYIMKPTTEMCNRVLGTSNPVCGIYKITNIETGEIYIGQSVNIADRWKQHIKCGLGIEASSTNKFYNNMQHTGVWNFTFQLLQKCARNNNLNEKEKFWIQMYQSNKIGLNMTKGNK